MSEAIGAKIRRLALRAQPGYWLEVPGTHDARRVARAEGAHGPLHDSRRTDVLARQRRTPARDRGGHEQDQRERTETSPVGPIGHATGTKATERNVKIISAYGDRTSDLRGERGAPNATRTRDLRSPRTTALVVRHGVSSLITNP